MEQEVGAAGGHILIGDVKLIKGMQDGIDKLLLRRR
jgi:hypothetical protein